jgi:hypothetical protein
MSESKTKRTCQPVEGTCKKAVKGKNIRCAEHKAEARKYTWRKATEQYRHNKAANDKSPHRLVFGEKPTRWAKLHPKEALKLAKSGNQTWLVPMFTAMVEKADKASAA